jgi:hypothetical protein
MVEVAEGAYGGAIGRALALSAKAKRRGQLAQTWSGSAQYTQRPFCLRRVFSASERGPRGLLGLKEDALIVLVAVEVEGDLVGGLE